MRFYLLAVLVIRFTFLFGESFSSGNKTVIICPISIAGRTVYNQEGEWTKVIIPLKRAGNLFLIEASIDTITGNFILDTGASNLVLNQTYFRDYMIVEEEEWTGVTGSARPVLRTRVKKLQVSELTYQKITADVTNLGHIENRRNVKILGLFGMSLLHNLEMVMDMQRNELHLYRLDKTGKRIAGSQQTCDFDISGKIFRQQNILFLKGIIGGKALTFCLDTGAESNVLNTRCSKKVMETVTITGRSNLRGVGTAGAEVLYGVLNDFSFADQQLPEMKAILANLDGLSQKYGQYIDGILGYDFFEKGLICINLVREELGICLVKENK